jgi:hypothetical protein
VMESKGLEEVRIARSRKAARVLLAATCVAGLGFAAGSWADPTVDGAECLPPGHPPVGLTRGLPPGHPPVEIIQGLPPGHPPVRLVPRLPAGHPPVPADPPVPLPPPLPTVTI